MGCDSSKHAPGPRGFHAINPEVLMLREKNKIMLETVQELTRMIKAIEKETQNTSQKIHELEAQQIQDHHEIAIARNKLETLEKNTKVVESQLEAVKNSNHQEKSGCKHTGGAEVRINLAVQTLAKERGCDSSTAKGLEKLHEQLQTEIGQICEKIETLQNVMDTNKKELLGNKEALKRCQDEINNLKEQIKEKLDEIKRINLEILGLTKKEQLDKVISKYLTMDESSPMSDQSLLEAIMDESSPMSDQSLLKAVYAVDPIKKFEVILNRRHIDGGTALHVAADRNHEFILDGLLDSLNEEQTCQLLNAQDKLGQTVFHRLAKKGFHQTFDKLLQEVTIEKRLQTQTVRDKTGKTAIQTAALSAKTETVFAVIDSLSIDDLYKLLSLTAGDEQKKTFMHRFISDNTHPDVKIVYKIATKMGFDGWYKLLALKDSGGRTPLHLVTGSKHVEITKAMEATTETESLVHLWRISDETHRIPILRASEGHFIVLKDLAERLNGEQLFELLIFPYKNQKTLVHILVLENDSDLLKLFMDKLDGEHRCRILQSTDKQGSTPIHIAAYCDHRETLNILLGYLAPKSEATYALLSKNNHVFSDMAIHLAAEKGNVQSIELMLEKLTKEHKINLLNGHNHFYWTPRVAAKIYKQMETAAWLEKTMKSLRNAVAHH